MRFNQILPVILLALFAACTQTAPDPPPAQGPPASQSYRSIEYVNPAGSGWRLVRDTSSTSTRLVLNLVGPAGTLSRGVGLTLQADAQAFRFGKFTDGAYLQDAGVFQLEVADPNEPKLLAGGVKGDKLMLGIFQKDYYATSKDCGTTLLQCAVELRSSPIQLPSSRPELKVVKARLLPDDISLITSTMETIEVAVGQLTLR